MKRMSIFFGVLVLLMVFGQVLISCSSGPVIYDKKIPLDERSILYTYPHVVITHFDDKVVKLNGWKSKFKLNGQLFPAAHIPAGKHTLGVVDNSQESLIRRPGKIEYEFLPGHQYMVDLRNTTTGMQAVFGISSSAINITDITDQEIYANIWKIVK